MNTVFEVIGMGAKKYGGFEKYIVEEARQLGQKGHRLVVIFDREPLAEAYVKDLRSLGCGVEVLTQTSKLQFVKGFWKLLRKYRPSVVHTNFSTNLFYAFPLAILAGVKRRVSTQHCLPTAENVKLRLAYQLTSLLANDVVAVSDMSAKAQRDATWVGKGKIHTLYLGVEDFSFSRAEVRKSLEIADDTVALMNIAYHSPVKGVDVLLRALHIIVNEYKVQNLILYQIGGGQTGSDTQSLHSLAQQLGIEDNIVWLGIRNDVPRLLTAGDIYVQPSRSEGIPLSIMEASLASLPIVATCVGGNPEAVIVNSNGLLVESENPRQLADAIMVLYNNKKKRAAFGCNGRKHALEKFCLKNQVANLLSDYYKL